VVNHKEKKRGGVRVHWGENSRGSEIKEKSKLNGGRETGSEGGPRQLNPGHEATCDFGSGRERVNARWTRRERCIGGQHDRGPAREAPLCALA